MREKRRYVLVEGVENLRAWVEEHLGLVGMAEGDVVFLDENIVRVRLEKLPTLLGIIALHPTAKIAKVSGTLKALRGGK